MKKRRSTANRDVALAIARERFGYAKLRPGQKEAIDAVLSGKDTLVVMPTGAGKSAIYQIPAVALPGPTVVISPLIALQKDQVETLEEQDVGGAAVVNSATPQVLKTEVFEELEGGDLEFLFLTPEQLAKQEVLDTVRDSEPSLFVVDEAHCISEWGHDFRPEYLRLGQAIEELGHPQAVALTATAGPQVREEIITRLGMREPSIIVRGFDRPNIRLAVESFQSEEEKLETLIRRVDWAEKPGIVYAASRKRAEQIAAALNERGITAFHYHGGMTAKDRGPIQDEFMADKYDVIVATSAFGMGIDKANVRFVFHHDAPHSIDAYYQEIGRAGRDGERAEAILFYRPEDLGIHKFFAGGSRIDEEKVQRLVEALRAQDRPLSERELKDETGLSKAKITRLLTRLSEMGAIELSDNGAMLPQEKQAEAQEIILETTNDEARVHEAELDRIERMRMYAELLDCRREYLLHYFGEEFPNRCDFCDNCEKKLTRDAAEQEADKTVPLRKPLARNQPSDEIEFSPHTRVIHGEWGKGVVQTSNGKTVTVLFDSAGEKTLSLQLIRERNLLEPAG